MKISEFALIELLRKRMPLAWRKKPGIGDDAAVLPGAGNKICLLTTDVIVEGIDFSYRKLSPYQAGRKALAVNLSDIAAMAGTPTTFVIALGIPKHYPESWILKFYEGLTALAKKHKVFCAGGDISRSRQFFASLALLGEARKGRVILRSGARPGDLIGVTGSLGGSILGHHHTFEPRLVEAAFLSRYGHPTSMMDISDGLVQDLGHILRSSGVGARLDLEKIPVSSAARKLACNQRYRALIHALSDGEDFELLFTINPRHQKKLERGWRRRFPKVPLSWIGSVRPGKNRIAWFRKGRPAAAPVRKTGFSHF